MTQRVARRLTVYGGIGICAVQVYRKYFDPALLLGSNGEYWIDGAAEERRTNFLAGVLVPVSPRIQVQAGVETMPRGFTIGLAWLTHGRR